MGRMAEAENRPPALRADTRGRIEARRTSNRVTTGVFRGRRAVSRAHSELREAADARPDGLRRATGGPGECNQAVRDRRTVLVEADGAPVRPLMMAAGSRGY